MFGRELRTLVDLVFGAPPEPEIAGVKEMDYFRRLRDRLQVVHDYTRQAQANSGVQQKRAYNTRCRGRALMPGDKEWVHCPVRKKGISPKLRNHGPGEVMGRLSEVVYWVHMPWWCCTRTDSHYTILSAAPHTLISVALLQVCPLRALGGLFASGGSLEI